MYVLIKTSEIHYLIKKKSFNNKLHLYMYITTCSDVI